MTLLSVVVVTLSIAVSVHVDPHVDNREVSVVLVPEDPQRADYWKTQSLDPQGGTFTARWPDLPKGTYAVLVQLQRYAMDGTAETGEDDPGLVLYGGAVAVK